MLPIIQMSAKFCKFMEQYLCSPLTLVSVLIVRCFFEQFQWTLASLSLSKLKKKLEGFIPTLMHKGNQVFHEILILDHYCRHPFK